MILEIDYGNTRLKWRLLDSNSLNRIAAGATTDLANLLLLLKESGCADLKFCRACSVRGSAENTKLTELIEEAYGVSVEYAESKKSLAGIINGYQCASQLGVDRWMAIVGAYTQIQDACIIIDCGTAITVDYVSTSGEHLGGCIAPGLKQMALALGQSTSLVVDTNKAEEVEQPMLGDNTQAAINAGIRMMLKGFIKEQLQLAQTELGASYAVLCTGGDSNVVCSELDGAVIQENLVFIGLAIACPYISIK